MPPLIDAAVAAFGGIDVLVRTAAVLVRRDSVDDVTEADWDLQHDVNLKSTFFLNQAVGQLFRAQGQRRPHHQLHLAGLADRRLRRLGRLCRHEGRHRLDDPRSRPHAGAKDGITVNAVSPGAADTAMMRSGTERRAARGLRRP